MSKFEILNRSQMKKVTGGKVQGPSYYQCSATNSQGQQVFASFEENDQVVAQAWLNFWGYIDSGATCTLEKTYDV